MKKTFNIYGMHCAGCSNSVEKVLKNVPGVKSADVQLTTEKAVVEFENGDVPVEDLKKAVESVGFEFGIPDLTKTTFIIEGMHCAGCTSSVEKAIMKVEGVHSAAVNLSTEQAVVEMNQQEVSVEEIEKSVEDAGYSVKKKTLNSQIN